MPRTVPVMGAAIPGNYITAAFWNANIKALGDFLANPPMFSGYRSATQSIPNTAGSFTAIVLDTETIDTDGGHSTTVNASRYTCQVAGVYELTGSIAFAAGGTGIRGADFQLNGVDIIGSESIVPPSATAVSTVTPNTTLVRMVVGDYVAIAALQNSGTLTTVMVGAAVCMLNAKWIAA